MLQEKWVKWNPLPNVLSQYSIDRVEQNCSNLILLLTDKVAQEKQLQILFENSAIFYRSRDESSCIAPSKIIYDSSDNAFWKHNFFKVENSLIIKQLIEGLDPRALSYTLMHFVCIDMNFVVDIVAKCEPISEWIQHDTRSMD